MIKIQGKKFVVTGAAGFIGSHIAEELVKQGKEVLKIDNRPVDPSITRCDVSYNPMLKRFTGADVVFHNAASKCTVCRLNPYKDLVTNAYGSYRVFHTAAKVGAKVVHASTGSVYGESGYQREDNQYAPRSFYGVSKLAAEQYLRCFDGLRWVALRYFHVYGPRQDATDTGGVVPIFITKMLKGEPLTVYGDGEQTRSFTYVRDVVKANFIAANSDMMEGEFYNVASGVRVSLNTLIGMIAEILDVYPHVNYEEERPGDIREFDVDNQKIASEGMDEWTNLQRGLEETAAWYKKKACAVCGYAGPRCKCPVD